jgi:hypothetical protein
MSRTSRDGDVWTLRAWSGDTVEVLAAGVHLIVAITDRAGNEAAAALSPDEGETSSPSSTRRLQRTR